MTTTDRQHDPGDCPTRQPEPVRAVLSWIEAHGRDVDEAPFWREYATLRDPGDRLRYLLAFVDRRPLDPLNCPRRGGTMDADTQRATVVVGYLLGDFAAPDLPRIAKPWTWREVAAYATAHGGDGWDGYRDAHRAPQRYRERLAVGALQIVCQPPDAKSILALVSAPALGRTIGGLVVATVGGTPGDASFRDLPAGGAGR